MKLSTINFRNKKFQFFVTKNITMNASTLSIATVLIDHTPSLVATLKNSDLIIKCIRARSWHEYIKILWNHSRISKEVHGSLLLAQLGLSTPKIHQVGIGLIPSRNYQFLGYYVMENLYKQESYELSKLIKNDKIDTIIRAKAMDAIYCGLRKMREKYIVFSDFHLENIFSNAEGEITWIDTGVTTYRRFNAKKFNAKYNQSIHRYINYEYKGENLLSLAEQSMFKTLLLSSK
jgi:hypothetical protein